jgi:hypothetical protein
MPAVPAAKRSINQDVFTWNIPGTRKKITVRSSENMTMRELRDIKSWTLDDFAGLGKTKADGEAILDLTKRDFMTFSKAWAEDGTMPLGKS